MLSGIGSRHQRQGKAAKPEMPLAIGMSRRHFLGFGYGLEEAVVQMRVHAHVVVDEEQLALQRGDVEAITLNFAIGVFMTEAGPTRCWRVWSSFVLPFAPCPIKSPNVGMSRQGWTP